MAQNPFEIPPQFGQLWERNLQQAHAAYGQFIDGVAQTMGLWVTAMPKSEMSSGLKAIHERSIQFSKQNADSYFAFASQLARAKNVQDAFAIQSRYAQTQMQTYTLQAQELGRLIAVAAQSI